MSNRYMNQFAHSIEQSKVFLFGKVAIGATGAPTLSAVNSKGIKSITRNSAGKYTIVLQDNYVRLYGASAKTVGNTCAAPTSWIFSEQVNSATSPSLILQFANAAGAATDPGNGETVLFQLILKNSTAP